MSCHSLFFSDGTDGFQMRYQNGEFSTNSCNSSESLLFFQCDKTAQWDIKNPNITGYITTDLPDGCLVRYHYLVYCNIFLIFFSSSF